MNKAFANEIRLSERLRGRRNPRLFLFLPMPVSEIAALIVCTVIDELETEVTFSASSRSNICPEDVNLSCARYAGVAFDNFAWFIETCDDKDTLHDNVGIVYQNVSVSDTSVISEHLNETDYAPRTFDTISRELITSRPKNSISKRPKLHSSHIRFGYC